MQWYEPKRHICVDPHQPYVEVLQENGYEAVLATAYGYLKHCTETIDSIYLLDVIEHMEKPDGQTVIDLSKRVAQKQIIVFTPMGFEEQSEDAWKMGGKYWQTHRSGWTPEDFPGWEIQINGKEGFFATCTLR